jgi:hypothetical protein
VPEKDVLIAGRSPVQRQVPSRIPRYEVNGEAIAGRQLSQ